MSTAGRHATVNSDRRLSPFQRCKDWRARDQSNFAEVIMHGPVAWLTLLLRASTEHRPQFQNMIDSRVRGRRAQRIDHVIGHQYIYLRKKQESLLAFTSRLLFVTRQRPTFPLPRGSSNIGLGGLNFRVRYGNGWGPSGMATGNSLTEQP